MEGRETPIMQKYRESKMTRIMMATVHHVTSEAGRTKFQAAGFLLNRVYLFIKVIKQMIEITEAYHFVNYIQNFIQHPAVNINSICRGHNWGSLWVLMQKVNY
jgi:hypothetical protein